MDDMAAFRHGRSRSRRPEAAKDIAGAE